MARDMDRELSARLTAEAVTEWLAKGNIITKIEEGRKTDPAELKNQWGRPRAKKAVVAEQPVDKPKKAAKIKK